MVTVTLAALEPTVGIEIASDLPTLVVRVVFVFLKVTLVSFLVDLVVVK